jgi:hypothetical protein
VRIRANTEKRVLIRKVATNTKPQPVSVENQITIRKTWIDHILPVFQLVASILLGAASIFVGIAALSYQAREIEISVAEKLPLFEFEAIPKASNPDEVTFVIKNIEGQMTRASAVFYSRLVIISPSFERPFYVGVRAAWGDGYHEPSIIEYNNGFKVSSNFNYLNSVVDEYELAAELNSRGVSGAQIALEMRAYIFYSDFENKDYCEVYALTPDGMSRLGAGYDQGSLPENTRWQEDVDYWPYLESCDALAEKTVKYWRLYL